MVYSDVYLSEVRFTASHIATKINVFPTRLSKIDGLFDGISRLESDTRADKSIEKRERF